jgi:hypothetical protein
MSSVKRRWQFQNGKFTAGSNGRCGIADRQFILAANTKPISTRSDDQVQ